GRVQAPAGELEGSVRRSVFVDELAHDGSLRARGDAVGRLPLSCSVIARGDVGAQQPVSVAGGGHRSVENYSPVDRRTAVTACRTACTRLARVFRSQPW